MIVESQLEDVTQSRQCLQCLTECTQTAATCIQTRCKCFSDDQFLFCDSLYGTTRTFQAEYVTRLAYIMRAALARAMCELIKYKL